MLIKKYSILSDFIFNLYELFPDFICANNVGGLVNNLFGVKIVNPFPSFTSSSPCSGEISGISINSSESS